MRRVWTALAGLAGFASVAGGAAARHLAIADPQRIEYAGIASQYAMYHALALLALAALAGEGRGGAGQAPAGGCFAAGILAFSGSLYGLAFGAPAALAWLTPVGGTLLLAGWALLGLGALRRPRG